MSPVIPETCCYLSCVRTEVACAILERTFNFAKVLEACNPFELLSCNIDLPRDSIGAVFHETVLLSIYLLFYNLCRFCRDLKLGVLAPALPQ